MDIWVPYTDLAPETGGFAMEAGAWVFPLADPIEDYGRFMARRWRAGAGFIVVEHDVWPSLDDIASLRTCSEPLCFYGYRGEDRTSLMFGCVRFSADFIAAHPDLWTRFLAARDVPEGHPDYDFSASRCRRWMMLPEWVDHATGAPAHFHGRVRHLARMAGRR
jgi:hypothetical protein